MTDIADAITETMLVKPVKQTRQKAAAPGQKYHPLPPALVVPPRSIPRLEGSAIYFFKNGQPMGTCSRWTGQSKTSI